MVEFFAFERLLTTKKIILSGCCASKVTYKLKHLDGSTGVSNGTLDVAVDELDLLNAVSSRQLCRTLVAAPGAGFLIERILWQQDSVGTVRAAKSSEFGSRFRLVFASVAIAQKHELVLDLLTPESIF